MSIRKRKYDTGYLNDDIALTFIDDSWSVHLANTLALPTRLRSIVLEFWAPSYSAYFPTGLNYDEAIFPFHNDTCVYDDGEMCTWCRRKSNEAHGASCIFAMEVWICTSATPIHPRSPLWPTQMHPGRHSSGASRRHSQSLGRVNRLKSPHTRRRDHLLDTSY